MEYLDKLYWAWDEFERKGFAKIEGIGVCLEMGEDLIEEQKGWADEDLGKNIELDPDAYYLCAEGTLPQKVREFNDLLEIEEDNLDFSIGERDAVLSNKITLSLEEWYKACEKIAAELEDWKGECYDCDNQLYRSSVMLNGGKVITFELYAEIDENDEMVFGDSVELKRVR